jgi:hypothetical protein
MEFMASGEVDRERGRMGAAERRLEGVRKLLAEAHARGKKPALLSLSANVSRLGRNMSRTAVALSRASRRRHP